MMKFLISFVLLCSLASCIVPESTHVEPTYHLLSETGGENNRTGSHGVSFHDSNKSSLAKTFYLRPVELPFYLHENKIIERLNKGEIIFRENHRWGEAIEEGVGRVLASNLAQDLDSPFYSVFPHRKKMGSHFEISVSLERFEKNSDSTVLLDGSWEVFSNDFENGNIPILNGSKKIEVQVEQNKSTVSTVSNEVLALSVSLHSFSKIVSQSIFTLLKN